MANYYVNTNAQPNGDHEVHRAGCTFMPEPRHQLFLGDFTGCAPAVRKAKESYRQSNGCYYCAPECHTG